MALEPIHVLDSVTVEPIHVLDSVSSWSGTWSSLWPIAAVVFGGFPVVPAILAVGLATVHVTVKRSALAGVVPRPRLLSFAGGVSVAYVFVHAFPELGRTRQSLADGTVPILSSAELVYVVTLAGFVAYYGLERLACRSEDRSCESGLAWDVFWVHIASFAAYNGIIGYLLFHREAPGIGNLVLFGVAMGLHMVVNDYSLQERHSEAYLAVGRWLLAGAVLVGGAVGAVIEFGRAELGLVFAFIAGGVVLNVIKEELPAESESSFASFAVGVTGYTALLLVL